MNNLTISENHGKFIDCVLSGMELDKAAKKAGFTHGSRDAYPILAEPQTRAYFKKKIRGRHETEGITIAYNYLMTVIRDEQADKRLRLDAAKFIYGNVLPPPKAGDPDDAKDKELADMSKEELHQFIEKTQDELANRAILVNKRPQAVDDLL